MTFNNEIKNLYQKSGYLDKYGGSFVVAIIIFIIFISIFLYHYFLSFLNKVKPDWLEEKCNPQYMAFAGLLDKNAGSDKMNYAGKNFHECVKNTLKGSMKTAMGPINLATKGITDLQQSNIQAVQGIREQVNYIRNNTASTVKNVMHRAVGFLIPPQNIILKIRDTFQKSVGVMSSALYTFYGFMVTLKSSMGYIISTIITFLVALAASVTMQFAVPFNWEMAQLGLQFFLLLAVPAGIVSHWFEQTFAITSEQSIPGNPRCFDGDKPIETSKGTKPIKEIKVGDKLKHDGYVTGIMKLSKENETIYNLNGVIVTGTHIVFHDDFGWLKVEEHPKRDIIKDHSSPFVYCINTTSKMIHIGDQLFLDWDETNISDLIGYSIQTEIEKTEDIHTFLDGGFVEETLLELENGESKKISDIKINDILSNREKVLGIVKIDGTRISHLKEYQFKDKNIKCGPNLQIVNNLGNVSTHNIIGKNIRPQKYLYNIITDTKSFYIGSTKFLDYNGSLEVLDIF